MTNDPDSQDGLDLAELCDEAGVTPRTVYYYTQQGLLPSPKSGRGARYFEGHRLRLAWIRHRQKAHLPLAAIRQELERLSDAELAGLLAGEGVGPSALITPSSAPPAANAALDYIDGLLAGPSSARTAIASSSFGSSNSPSVVAESSPPTGSEPHANSRLERSVWQRHRLSEDIELHVRRPLDRITNRRVERLLDLARQLLSEG